jgi:hypothetical protein
MVCLIFSTTLENTKGQSKNDNLEKLTTSGTQYEIKQSKAQHNVCWTPLTYQPNVISFQHSDN